MAGLGNGVPAVPLAPAPPEVRDCTPPQRAADTERPPELQLPEQFQQLPNTALLDTRSVPKPIPKDRWGKAQAVLSPLRHMEETASPWLSSKRK
ncbi:hypothetical protein MHYP_G00039310 [Metynnis hypsauchen]